METAAADTALVRSIVGVNVHVHPVGGALPERISAFRAFVLFDIRMRELVVFQTVEHLKGHSTFFALEWSTVSVYVARMFVQGIFTDKRRRTFIAGIWLIVQMSSHVQLPFGGT